MHKPTSAITHIQARQILDSRGNPTIEADITLQNGAHGRASVPSGASTGKNEALELRDNNPKHYHGKSVTKAIKNIQTKITPHLIGLDAINQTHIDQTLNQLDNTPNKTNLGANATLAISLATAKAAANHLKQPLYRYLGGTNTKTLPIPLANIINGGAHSDAPLDYQEFMIRPQGLPTYTAALRAITETYHTLKQILKTKNLSTNIGDEGGFAPQLKTPQQTIETILLAIKKAGYKPGKHITIALDIAASELYNPKTRQYTLKKSTQQKLTGQQLIQTYQQLTQQYPITSIEDPCAETDWKNWKHITQKLGSQIQLVGDDLFVTNTQFLQRGIQQNTANSILIKPNQIGTLTQTLDTIQLAQTNHYTTIISHRSGETEDTTIADIAVATNAGQIKTGAPTRTDRTAKYNQLLRIEQQLGPQAHYPTQT